MVFIVPPTGKILSLDINPNTTTLHNLKLSIEQFHGISIEQQRIFLSQSLPLLGHNDSVLISNLGVGNYSTITLHVPFYGGTQPPPRSNDVARLGGGAMGFTRRSDIGPAHAAPDLPDRSATTVEEEDDEGKDKGYNEFEGNDVGLFASDVDDREADIGLTQTEEVVWLKDANEKWLAGDVAAARAILQEAYTAIPNSEAIWLAAFKLEFENQEPERARMLLTIVERELGENIEVDEGLKQFSSFYKLWLMLGQLEERLGEAAKQQDQPEKRHVHMMEAKKVYCSGLKRFPNSVPLWLSLANIEEEMSEFSKVRAVLTIARKKNPQNPELWLASVRAELKHGYKKEADILICKSLLDCPNSGILWAEETKH